MSCRDFTCGLAEPGPYTPGACRRCWAALNHPAVARSLGRPEPPPLPPGPCCPDPGPVFAPPPKPVRARRHLPPASSDPPRVLICSHYLERDGAPTALLNVVPRLRHLHPTVYSPQDGPLRARYEAAGVRVVVGALPDPGGYDVLLANTIASAPAVAAGLAAGVPVVWLVQEATPDWCGNRVEVARLIPHVAATVFPTAACRDAYLTLRPANPQVIPTLIPPVPVRDRERERFEFGYQPDDFVVLTFGRDEPRKGQADLRAAVAPGIGVTTVYAHDHPDPHGLLAAADLYVCTSREETFPLATQEAAAHGLPVVSTPAGLLSGVSGDVYQPGDVAALRRLILAHKGEGRPFAPVPPPPSRFDHTLAAWESVIRAACRRLPPPEVRVVYHVAGLGPLWREIAREQLAALAAAGLSRVHCTHVGKGLDRLYRIAREEGVELLVAHSSPDLTEFERPGVRLAHRLALGGDGPVLYLHTKGVSRTKPGDEYNHDWRRLMMRELVGGWREHAADLAAGRYDAAGVNWWTRPEKEHFSGNFWLATAAWLRGLPDPDQFYRDRWSCERWVGSRPGCRAKSLVCQDREFWAADRAYLLAAARG